VHTARNVVPMITCSPWNPVATKNVDPYTESAMVNGDSQYSKACRAVKYIPSITVRINPCRACVWLACVKLWWAHVTVTPDASRMDVFRRGI